MFTSNALFALLGAENIAAVVIKCLAVGGAFLAGYALGGLIAFALDRWLFAKKSPDVLKKSVRTLAGVAVAVLVALIVFGDGSGGGLFGGAGTQGTGKGNPDANDSQKDKNDQSTPPTTQPTPKDPPKVVPNKSPDVKPDDPRIHITFLGGDAVPAGESTFYRIDSDPVSKTLKQVMDEVEKRKRAHAPRQLFLYVQYPTDSKLSAGRDTRTVKDVTEAAERLGVKVVQ